MPILWQSSFQTKIVAVGQATETTLAQGVQAVQLVLVNQVLETDVSQQSKPLHVKSLAQATETDLAQHAGEIQRVSELQATESDVAQAVTARHVRAIAQALDNQLAQAVTVKHVRAVAQATESDIAQSVKAIQLVLVNQAIEVDSAFAATQAVIVVPPPVQAVYGPGGAPSQQNERRKLAAPIVVNIGRAQEFDAALACSFKRFVAKPLIVEKPLFVSDIVPVEVFAEPAPQTKVYFRRENLPRTLEQEVVDLLVSGLI